MASTLTECRQSGGNGLALQGDVGQPDVVARHLEAIVGALGPVDVLVNNAGVMRRAASEDLAHETWREVMRINIDGAFYWAQAAAKQCMIPRERGAIVNVASIAGMAGIPNAAAYAASKHALVGLTRALAVDWGRHDIRVNALCPGMTWSNLSRADLARDPDMFVERQRRIPLGHAAEPHEQAEAILFLASDAASYVHGLVMNVDGGQIALSSGHSAPRA